MIPRLEINFSAKEQIAFLFGKHYIPNKNEFLLNHARSGILLALQSLNLKPGSKVGVMAYNCHTVFNAVAQGGNEIVYIDVSDTLTIDLEDLRKKAGELSALVVTHLFGIESDVKVIRAEFPNLPIIEDCAHAYGSEHTDGDIAVNSLGQGKLPSIGPGGILTVNNEAYLQSVSSLYSKVPSYSPRHECYIFISLLTKSFLYTPIIYTILTQFIKKRHKASAVELIKPMKMSNGINRIYAEQYSDTLEYIQRRKERAQTYCNTLKDYPQVDDILYGNNAFMLVCRCNDISYIKALFKKRGIETATHFSRCIDWASEHGYVKGSCPNTERLVKQLLMIPTYR